MVDPHSPITTWTTLPLPLTNAFFVFYSPRGSRRMLWLLRVSNQQLSSLESYFDDYDSWKSHIPLAEFEASPGYEIYLNGMSKLGPPHLIHVDFGKSLICKYLKGYSAFTTIYFPSSITSVQREAFNTVKGFVDSFGLGAKGVQLWRDNSGRRKAGLMKQKRQMASLCKRQCSVISGRPQIGKKSVKTLYNG